MAIAPGSYSFMGGTVLGKGSEGQFVLVRSGDILTTFTGDEYSACVEAVNDGKAVCVQWESGSARMQAQLATMLADGTLLFSHTTVDTETIYTVAGSNPHNITAHTNSLGGGSQVQSNWRETDTSSPAYIQNKPSLARVATTGRYSDLTGKPTIPDAQVNSDWSAQVGKARILNKPITMPNATGGLRKTLDADDITNGYVEFKIGTGGSYTGPYDSKNPAFVLFGKLYNLRYNGRDADNYIDTAEVGLYSDGIVGKYIQYYTNSHAELVADNAKGWGVSGWWGLMKDKYLSVYVRLTLTSSATAGDEVFCHFTSGIFGTGLFEY